MNRTRGRSPDSSPAHTIDERLQLFILVAVIGIYFAYSLYFVSEYLYRPILGCAVILAIYAFVRRIGPRESPGREPIAPLAAAYCLFVMPVLASPGPRQHGLIASALGAFAAQGTWAIFRYPYQHTPNSKSFLDKPFLARSKRGVLAGFGIAAALSIVVALFYGTALAAAPAAARAELDRQFAGIVLAYFGGGALAGLVVGSFAPLIRWPLGAMVMGIPLTAAVYGAIAVVMPMFDDAGNQEQIPVWFGMVALSWIAPMWGIMVKGWIEKQS